MKRFVIAVAAMALTVPAWAGADPERILRPGTETAADRDTMLGQLSKADVVVLGEIHDNPVHHLNQAWVIARLAPGGLVAEMLLQSDEARIRGFLTGGGAFDGIGALVGWGKTGWPDWAIYAPAFRALPEGAVIAGAGVPRKTVRRIMSEPAAALFEDERFKAVLEKPLPPTVQVERERQMHDSHCGQLPVDMAPMMVEVQRLRDASLAEAVLRLHRDGVRPIVVMTGNGHARKDWGLPLILAEVAPDLTVRSIGQIEIDGEDDPAEAPFDYAWITERHDRTDPCEKLRERKKP